MKPQRNFWDDADERKLPKKKGSDIQFDQKKITSLDEIERLYTKEEVAAVLGINPITLYKWIGKWIECEKDGPRSVRFTAQQVADCRQRRLNNCPLEKRKRVRVLGRAFE